MVQLSTLSTQSAVRSELIDWCRCATPVRYRNLLMDLLPRTDDLPLFSTNSGSPPWKKIFLKVSSMYCFCTKNTQNLRNLQVIQIFFQNRKFPFFNFPETAYPVSLQIRSISSQRKPAKPKEISLGTILEQCLVVTFEEHQWSKDERFWQAKILQSIKRHNDPMNKLLSVYGAVCSGLCFCNQQFE